MTLATGTAAAQRRRPEDEDEPANGYDPFAVLDQHGQRYDTNGNLTHPATNDSAPVTINAHAADADPQGGLHTTGLKTTGLVTTGLQGPATPVGNGTSVARVVPAQTNVVVQGGGGGGGGRAHVAPAVSYPASLGAGSSASGGSAISDGSTYVASPTQGKDGRQDGFEYLTPDQANWKANFGHLPGTASHPTQPAASAFPVPPSIPVRVASGAGVAGTGLPHDVAVELDQVHRNGTGTSFSLPPGGYGKTWQGTPGAPPVGRGR